MTPPAPSADVFGSALRFHLPSQEQDSWCWAACASAVARYFDPASGWAQCRVAEATLGVGSCCQVPIPCDRTAWVLHALEATGNFAARHVGPVAWDALIGELEAGRPVVARIRNDVSHFVVIDGYRRYRAVRVRDPLTESSLMVGWRRMRKNYRGGVWSHTYFTGEAP